MNYTPGSARVLAMGLRVLVAATLIASTVALAVVPTQTFEVRAEETPQPQSAPAPQQPDYRDLYERLTGASLSQCPSCGRGHMVCVETFAAGCYPRAAAPDSS
jgi:hypothetical protein